MSFGFLHSPQKTRFGQVCLKSMVVDVEIARSSGENNLVLEYCRRRAKTREWCPNKAWILVGKTEQSREKHVFPCCSLGQSIMHDFKVSLTAMIYIALREEGMQ